MSGKKRWIFTTMHAGSYTEINEFGEEQQHTGLHMYLGIEYGDTADEAFARLYTKHDLKQSPKLAKSTINAFELADNTKDAKVSFEKMLEWASKPTATDPKCTKKKQKV